ncbi:MAG: hypothetical protein U0168_17425 [Nannocystaceae bacterium]
MSPGRAASTLVLTWLAACGADEGRGDGGTATTLSSTTLQGGSSSAGGSGSGSGDGTTGGGASMTSMGGTDGSTSSDFKFDLGGDGSGSGGPTTYPVRMIPGLVSITFYERSGGDAPTPYTFAVDGAELTTRLDDPLGDANRDIKGVDTEFYDVYYSDQDGVFELDGRYLTISGVFAYALPAGGGLNLAEIGLEYEGQPTEFGNYVASFVALGDNAAPETVEYTIDGDLQTNTTMGNTIGQNERLRVTLGFESSSGPPG